MMRRERGRLRGKTGFFASTMSQKDIVGERRRQKRTYEDVFPLLLSIFQK
jgi:hypothetical protein